MVEERVFSLEFEFGKEEIQITGTNYGLSGTPRRKSHLISIPYDLSMSWDPEEVLNILLRDIMEELRAGTLRSLYYSKYHSYKIEFKEEGAENE